MPVVTITGRMGSQLRSVGLDVARQLGADYIDYQILAMAAKRSGAAVEHVLLKDEYAARGKDRLSSFFNNFLEKSAAAGSADDPFLGAMGVEMLMQRNIAEAGTIPRSSAEQLNDKRYLEALTSVIQDEAKTGNAVIIGRGSNVILKDLPNALHTYLVSSEENRMRFVMERDNLSPESATRYMKDSEAGRQNFFKKFFNVRTEDPVYYHLFLNSDRLGVEHCARIIVEAAKAIERSLKKA